MSDVLGWVAGSGVVQGVIIGATLAYLTAIVVLDTVARAETTTVNGWAMLRRAGRPGLGLLTRAAVQKALPVVNVVEEAAYWTTGVDGSGRRLTGRHSYRLRFPPGGLPPNNAFWSLTATDVGGYQVSVAAGRSSVGDRTGLTSGPDGSVEIVLRAQAPADRTRNWLATPAGRFRLTLRAYLPGAAVLDGTYAVPPVVEDR